MVLIARWNPTDFPAADCPDLLMWEDGSPATMADYRAKAEDTFRDDTDDAGFMSRYIYSDIIADVYYDVQVMSWAIRGASIIDAGSLEIADPNASDLDLAVAALQLTMSYRIRISRNHMDRFTPPKDVRA